MVCVLLKSHSGGVQGFPARGLYKKSFGTLHSPPLRGGVAAALTQSREATEAAAGVVVHTEQLRNPYF